MDKIRTILVIMLFFGAALAGCTGEEIEQVVDDNTNDTTNSTAEVGPGAMFVYIQSGEYGFGIAEQFPLSLHFGAPPMSDNSPYELEKICSVDDGHANDVYSTWVKSSGGNAGDFNDITSWSVKNNNNLQLDHFAYDPMSDIIDFENPMVVFEDNLSWDGHITAEVFDQSEWNCMDAVEEPNTAVYAATDILAMLGVDGSDDAELDFMAPADGQEKFGIVMVINAPMDSLGLTDDEDSPSSGGGEDVEIIITNMFDNTTKRVASHMVMTMNMGGMSMQIHMKDTQGQHPEFSNVGYINQVMTNMETYQPEATWLIDNDWSYERALEEIMPMDDDECNGNGYMMDSMGEMGPHCMCDEGYDWDEEDMMTCVSSEDGDMGDECPFDADNDLSPCNAVECEDHDSDECMQYVVNYCEEHPDDGACVVHNDSDPAFICGDGSEVPFDYVNDGDQDCPDGADEQQYNDDGTKLNWFDCHDGTQIWIDQVNDGVGDCAHGEDEAGDHDDGMMDDGMMDIEEPEIGPDMPEPTPEELAAANWTTSIDETSGIQTFTGIVTMEGAGEWTYELSVMPTVPPVMKSLKMENDTVSYDISLLYDDEVVIDLVTEDAPGWEKGASDITLMMGGQMHDITTEDTDGDGIDDTDWEYMSFMYGFFGMYEVPSNQLELHIMSPEYDEDGNEAEQTVLASFTLENTPDDGWTQLGNWTDSNDNTWDVSFNCNNVYGMLDPEECSLSLSTYGEANESIEPAGFELALYDTWAEDYTGNAMPSFTLGLSLIALLGACLSRRKLE